MELIHVNPWRKLSRICLFARIAHPPTRVRPIIAYQQRSVRGLGHPHRTPPYIAIWQHESSQEIFILPRGMSRLMQGNPNHFVSHAHTLVPRSMLGRKNIALVLRRELAPLIERKLERS